MKSSNERNYHSNFPTPLTSLVVGPVLSLCEIPWSRLCNQRWIKKTVPRALLNSHRIRIFIYFFAKFVINAINVFFAYGVIIEAFECVVLSHFNLLDITLWIFFCRIIRWNVSQYTIISFFFNYLFHLWLEWILNTYKFGVSMNISFASLNNKFVSKFLDSFSNLFENEFSRDSISCK